MTRPYAARYLCNGHILESTRGTSCPARQNPRDAVAGQSTCVEVVHAGYEDAVYHGLASVQDDAPT